MSIVTSLKNGQMCMMLKAAQCVTEAHALISYLHTVIKFLLSTAPVLPVLFFRAALNPRLGDAIPASCAAQI